MYGPVEGTATRPHVPVRRACGIGGRRISSLRNFASGRRRLKTIVPVASSVWMPWLRSQLRGRLLHASAPTSGNSHHGSPCETALERTPEVARLDERSVRVADAGAELEGVPGSAGRDHRQRAGEVRHDLRALAPAAPRGADQTVVGGAERGARPGPGREDRIDRAEIRPLPLRRPVALHGGRRPTAGRRTRPGSPETASPFGRFAMGIRSTTRFSVGSMRAIASRTRRSPRPLLLQPRCRRDPPRRGSSPPRSSAGRCARRCRRASSRPTRSRRRTQPRSVRSRRSPLSTTRPLRESIRTTLRLDPSVTQILPPPTAMPRPSAPGRDPVDHLAANGVDLRDAALFRARHPDRSFAEGKGRRRHTYGDRLDLTVRLRVDPRHGAVQRVRHPDPAGPDGDPAWIAADVDALEDATRPGIDARDGAFMRVRHPDRPFTDRQARRTVADRHLGHEPIRPRVDRSNRVGRSSGKPSALIASELDDGHGNRRRQRAGRRRSRSGGRFGGELGRAEAAFSGGSSASCRWIGVCGDSPTSVATAPDTGPGPEGAPGCSSVGVFRSSR